MDLRVGKVTNVYANTGRVKVEFEDADNTSCEIPMLTFNAEYLMPKVGDKVVTAHLGNGMSKGFVLGTYYGAKQPKASSGYRKDFSSGTYAKASGGNYSIHASSKASISGGGAALSLDGNASLVGTEATLGSGSGDEDDAAPETYVKTTSDTVEGKGTNINLEAESEMTLKGLTIGIEGTTLSIKGTDITIEASNLTLSCSYGSQTLEQILKRIERCEDQHGLPHTI